MSTSLKLAWHRRLFGALVALSSLGLGAGCDDGTTACDCFICDGSAAVTISVFERQQGIPIDDFVVEAIYNDVPMGEPEGCRAENRTDNSCGIGTAAGVYQLTVQSPGYLPVQTAVRISEPGASELCCRACLSSKRVDILMDEDL